jgi:ATP-dependent Clp protease ATP-binding subunit ClpA
MTDQLTFDERFSKFTPSAVVTLTLAQEEAHRHTQNYIGTEHLLLGMLREGTGLGTTILTNLGVGLVQLGVTIEEIIRQAGTRPSGGIGLTPRAKRVIELAVEEARGLGHHYIGQEHLLLGFMREGDSIAARMLLEHGVTLERLRAEVLRLQAILKPAALAAAPKNNVITCRLTDDEAQALDDLVEAGVRSTRSDAAAWLIHVGIAANAQLLETVRGTVAEIRRLREHAQTLAQQVANAATPRPTEPEQPSEPLPS